MVDEKDSAGEEEEKHEDIEPAGEKESQEGVKTEEKEPSEEEQTEEMESSEEDEGSKGDIGTIEDTEKSEEEEPEGEKEPEEVDVCAVPEKRPLGKVLALFFIPWMIALIEVSILWIFLDGDTFRTLGFWMILYFFPPLGKESVIPAAIGLSSIESIPDWIVSIDPLLIALAIASIDIIVGLFLVWNFDFAKKIPILGKFICKLESKGGDLLKKNKYVEALSFVGVTLFVIVPFQGSGAVGASIIGRAIGMNPYKVWAAIVLGAVSGCLLIAYAFNTFKSIFVANRLLGVLILVAIFIVIIVYFIRKRKNSTEEGECEDGSEK
jgi:uncharacterized membrane protein